MPRVPSIGRALSALRRRPRSTLAAGLAAVAVAAAVVVPVSAAAAEHDGRLTSYRDAHSALVPLARELGDARSEFDTAHAEAVTRAAQLHTILATSDGLLLPPQRAVLSESADALATAVALTPGEQSTPAEASATSASSSMELRTATETLSEQARRERGWLHTTRDATAALTDSTDVATAVLDQVVTGTAAAGDRPAVPGLDAAATSILTGYPRADQATKDALSASARTALAGVRASRPSVPLLTDFLAKAQAVRASQAAVDAAAAAAAAEAAARAAAEEAARSAGSRSGGGSPSTGGGSTGAVFPPPPVFNLISHKPQVLTNENYSPGCRGSSQFDRIATNQGYELMGLDYDFPYDYTSYPTADSWGVTVYDCS